MSNTPRTDAHIEGLRRDPEVSGCDRTLNLCRQLERELTAAQAEALKLQEENAKLQERVRRFEEAGNAILWYFRPKDTGDISFLQSEAIKQWAAAKGTQ